MNIRVTSKNCDQLLNLLSERGQSYEQDVLFIIHNWMVENSDEGEEAAFDNRMPKSYIKQYIEFLENLKVKSTRP